MIDLSLLRILKHRGDFYRIKGRVPTAALDEQTAAILEDFGRYFERFPDHQAVKIDTFIPLFRSWHPNLTKDHQAAYDKILADTVRDVPDGDRDGVVAELLELRMGTELGNLLAQWDAGDVPNLHEVLLGKMEEFRADARITGLDFIRDPLSDLLADESNDAGLRWRMDCLNSAMRGLRPGDFGIVAGRPDKGKTTFIASELTHLAAQLPDDQNALWLNNEGPGRRIIPRLYQAALGARISELVTLNQAGAAEKAFTDKMGRQDRIRIIDIHGLDTYAVERLFDAHRAGLVVYDMIDHIRGFGSAAREDQRLEALYKWARECAVRYGHAGIATSQISVEGDGLQFPTQSMLKDSKTAKQGACDFIMMIGASNDTGLANQRFIGLPKNKLRREGAPGDPRATVRFDAERARYSDIPEKPPTSPQE